MLDHDGFNLWADGYDRSVGLSDESGVYPFAGYKDLLNKIYQAVLSSSQKKVLDIGFGTGTLTSKLYEQGCEIWGQDFSENMIAVAHGKMPHAKLYQGDFSEKLVDEIEEQKFDAIIATYSLHHLTDVQKIAFIENLRLLLKKNGSIYIGDVAFENREKLEFCRKDSGDAWDEDEIYFVYDELQKMIPDLEFEKISECAGLLTIRNN